jgi:hypothetical protein
LIAWLEEVESGELESSLDEGVRMGVAGLEGVANRSDPRPLRGVAQRSHHLGEDVCVLMGVEVRWVDASFLYAADLGGCFALDVIRFDTTA